MIRPTPMAPSVKAGIVAVVATLLLVGAIEWRAARTAMTAGFWFEPTAFRLPAHLADELGGPLTPAETDRIAYVARRELDQAFAGLDVVFPADGTGFWRVQVVDAVSVVTFRGRRMPFAVSGATLGFGLLGGRSAIGLTLHATNAVRYTPEGVTRTEIVDAIGRGVGRAAVHEFGHQIAGSQMDNRTDRDTYEYFSSDRASQYYGTLRWGPARARIREKVGERH